MALCDNDRQSRIHEKNAFIINAISLLGCFMTSTDRQLFADDTAFYTTSPSLSNVVSILNNDLDKLDQHLSGKGLFLNPSRTRFVVLRKPCHQLPEHYRLTCRGITISCCERARHLAWCDHRRAPYIGSTCKRGLCPCIRKGQYLQAWAT